MLQLCPVCLLPGWPVPTAQDEKLYDCARGHQWGGDRDISLSETYVIAWVSRVTGEEGIGVLGFRRDIADQLAERWNDEFPEINHWAVRIKPKG